MVGNRLIFGPLGLGQTAMRKLRKLLRNPSVFWADFLTKRTWLRQTHRQRHLYVSTLFSKESLFAIEGDNPITQTSLIECIKRHSSLFTTKPSGLKIHAHCLDTHIHDVLTVSLTIANEVGWNLDVTARRKRHSINKYKHVPSIAWMCGQNSNILLTFSRANHAPISILIGVWQHEDLDTIVCQSNHPALRKLPVTAFERAFDPDRNELDFHKLFACPISTECTFPVDVVYTWVNHADPEWQRLISRFRDDDDIDWSRYHSIDELRYSLRSLHLYAPWVRKIFIVTNCQAPDWLRTDSRVEIVPHEHVFANPDYLPTFSSHAIEACLMNIDGLSEHFVYFNDDVFLANPALKEHFFTGTGCSRAFLEPYGMVWGEQSQDHADYLNAAINGQRLLENRFGRSATQLHQHTPHALKRSVLTRMVTDFPDAFHQVRGSRFRSITDISTVSFLYHHYALMEGEAIVDTCRSMLVKADRFPPQIQKLETPNSLQFFCINDGGHSTDNTVFMSEKVRILELKFPNPAPWEKAAL